MEQAETIKDIIVQPHFRFHALKNKDGRDLKGYFAIDVKTHKEPWRIILQLLDEAKNPFEDADIAKIADYVCVVSIEEVSNHYG